MEARSRQREFLDQGGVSSSSEREESLTLVLNVSLPVIDVNRTVLDVNTSVIDVESLPLRGKDLVLSFYPTVTLIVTKGTVFISF